MDKKSFFGDKGLSSTSANHYANLAKEAVRKQQDYLNNIRFYWTKMNVIGSQDGEIVNNGCCPDDLIGIPKAIELISGFHSLIAFFREAIKEKERLAAEAVAWEDTEKRADYEARYRELQSAKPFREAYITESDVLASWSIGEREKYLSLEAEASTYGKYIHEDGCISKARIDLMSRINNPKMIKENGRDTLVYSYTPTVDSSLVDEMYFKLQKHQREVQAELNGMKKRINDAIEAHKVSVDEKYRLAYAKWSEDVSAMTREFQMIQEEESAVRIRMSSDVKNLKIVVPKRLEQFVSYLNEL